MARRWRRADRCHRQRSRPRVHRGLHLRVHRVPGAVTTELRVAKAHAYGNDFLFVEAGAARFNNLQARESVILFELRDRGATMRLFNADGGAAELSGNGLRCLAALIARRQNLRTGDVVTVDTTAGTKTLELKAIAGAQYTFRAALGPPAGIRQAQIPVLGETVTASVLSVGNPQCVVLGPLPDQERFNRFGPALSKHSMFPAGTNVEFAHVEAGDRVRILIWERGVGPTTSSGTGSAASAVAAAAHGGATREVDVIAPGGTQRVEWRDDGIYLTGWAEVVVEGTAYLT
ncbi:MAG: diaminopimelate epimerase [Acidobacteria bacterium]|nr:MAG: diaminopimelate epimerase [Acidobacteriota bacterium]